jgi:hypothetical protein
LADEEALGGTSTSGVTGTEAGDGLAFFLGFLESLLSQNFLLKCFEGSRKVLQALASHATIFY